MKIRDDVLELAEKTETKPEIQPIPLDITLNGKPLHFDGKESGEPYYLMDMLEHSGIDFKNLDSHVKIEINGESGAFQSVLKDNDSVIISKV